MSQPAARAAEPLAAQFQTNPPRDVPTRRNTELVLLGFAAFIVTIALVLVEANQEQELTWSIVWLGLAYLAIFAAAHLAVRKWAPYADPVLLPCVALLNGIGLVMIHRIDLALAERAAQNGKDYTPAVTAQVLFTVISLLFFVVVLVVVNDHRTLTRYGYTAGLVGIVALALPALLPSSLSEVNGAKVWLKLPGFSIQPGEFAKILLMIFFASFLVSKRDLFMVAGKKLLGVELPRARDLGPDPHRRGRLHRHPGVREGPRHVAAVLQRHPGHALRRDRAGHLGRPRAWASSSAAACSPTTSSRTSSSAWRTGSTRWPPTTRPAAATRSRRACSGSAPAASAAPASAPDGRTWSRRPTPTSSPPRSARSSASSAWPPS